MVCPHVRDIPWFVHLYGRNARAKEFVDYLHAQAEKHGITMY